MVDALIVPGVWAEDVVFIVEGFVYIGVHVRFLKSMASYGGGKVGVSVVGCQ